MTPLRNVSLTLLALMLGGYAVADALPEGSRQRLLTEALAKATLSTPYEPCPPVANMKGVQVACYNYAGREPLSFMSRIDEILFTFSTFPDTFPGLEDSPLTPRTDYWIYLPEFGRFERSFGFAGGTYRMIYVPFEGLSSNIAILFTPPGNRAQTLPRSPSL